MARSKALQEAYRVAEAYSRELDLRAHESKTMDPRFNYAVQVLHEEGTSFFYRNAFAVRWGTWHIVIPEHHDITVYSDDEAQVFMFKTALDEVEEITDVSQIGIEEATLEWGPNPYGELKRKAKEDAALEVELDVPSPLADPNL